MPGDDRAFRVMVIGDETSQISFTVAEAVPAVEAAFADLPNVEVLHCDSAGDANTNQECMREAVDEGVAIVVASFGQIGEDVAILTEAGIPVIGGSDPKAPNSFSLSSGLAAYAGLGVAAGEAECGTIATLYLDGAEFLADMVQQGAELQGAEEVGRSGIPQNTPDIAPQVAALTGTDADCIILSVTPTQVIQAVTALDQAGVEAQLIAVGAVFPPEIIDELGDLAEGVILSEVQLNPNDGDPAIASLAEAMAEVDPDAAGHHAGRAQLGGGEADHRGPARHRRRRDPRVSDHGAPEPVRVPGRRCRPPGHDGGSHQSSLRPLLQPVGTAVPGH